MPRSWSDSTTSSPTTMARRASARDIAAATVMSWVPGRTGARTNVTASSGSGRGGGSAIWPATPTSTT